MLTSENPEFECRRDHPEPPFGSEDPIRSIAHPRAVLSGGHECLEPGPLGSPEDGIDIVLGVRLVAARLSCRRRPL